VSHFAEDAAGLLETAEAAWRSGGETGTETAILICESGAIRVVSGPGWSLSGLRAQYGAKTAYHLTFHNGRARVEGREPGRACVIESECPARALWFLIGSPAPLQFETRPVDGRFGTVAQRSR
jgi:hypothetical protein